MSTALDKDLEGAVHVTARPLGRIDAAGFREAETCVERYLRRYPDTVVEVFVDGALAYRASSLPGQRKH